MAKPVSKSNRYEQIPAGAHSPAVVAKVIDCGEQPPPPMAENKDPRWEYGVCVEFPNEIGADGKPLKTWITCSESLHPKSRLGNLFAAAGLGTDGTPDPEELVDANVTAIVEEKQRNGNTYSNITSFAPLPKNVVRVKAVHRGAVPPEWLKRKIESRLDQIATDGGTTPKW